MFEHGKIFKHKKQSVVLIYDRIILSIDDKGDEEFVFAIIKDDNIEKTLYFVVSFESYTDFKINYQKAKIVGFWHSLFINNKINLAKHNNYQLKTDESIYTLVYHQKEINISFQLLSQLSEPLDYVDIDTNLDKYSVVISPADKAKKQRLEKLQTLSLIVLFWFVVLTSLYFYIDENNQAGVKLNAQIISTNQQISLIDKKIEQQHKKVYKLNKHTIILRRFYSCASKQLNLLERQ